MRAGCSSSWRSPSPRTVPALAASPVSLRNVGVLTFDVTFILPMLFGAWHRRGSRRAVPWRAPTRSSGKRPGGLRLRTIALVGAAAFLACWAFGPASPADLDKGWYPFLHPLIDGVRSWSGNIGRIERDLAASAGPDAALFAGTRLALLWILPGVAIIAGFLCRWIAMTPEQAAWQCAANRSRFSGTDVLRTVIDRAIVVLFVLSLPMVHEAGGADPAVMALAHSIVFVAVGGRGMTLMLLLGIGLDWLIAESRLHYQGLHAPYRQLQGHALGDSGPGGRAGAPSAHAQQADGRNQQSEREQCRVQRKRQHPDKEGIECGAGRSERRYINDMDEEIPDRDRVPLVLGKPGPSVIAEQAQADEGHQRAGYYDRLGRVHDPLVPCPNAAAFISHLVLPAKRGPLSERWSVGV